MDWIEGARVRVTRPAMHHERLLGRVGEVHAPINGRLLKSAAWVAFAEPGLDAEPLYCLSADEVELVSLPTAAA